MLVNVFEQLKAKCLAVQVWCKYVLFSQFQVTCIDFDLAWQAEFHSSYIL